MILSLLAALSFWYTNGYFPTFAFLVVAPFETLLYSAVLDDFLDVKKSDEVDV